jgi:hypothetical protein
VLTAPFLLRFRLSERRSDLLRSSHRSGFELRDFSSAQLPAQCTLVLLDVHHCFHAWNRNRALADSPVYRHLRSPSINSIQLPLTESRESVRRRRRSNHGFSKLRHCYLTLCQTRPLLLCVEGSCNACIMETHEPAGNKYFEPEIVHVKA